MMLPLLGRVAVTVSRTTRGQHGLGRFRPVLEPLEDRTLPSHSGLVQLPTPIAAPVAHLVTSKSALPAGGSGLPGGFSPSQIRQAYGFNQINFNNGSIAGDGSGQTIAIIDAYDQPNIASDLAVFDSTFGLPAPPSFLKVNQAGGTSYPAVNANWGLEISLDVEWAHAVAPGANILLVEANSSSYSDLLKAVDYARNQPGTAVVSMSWGSAEFSWEASYDGYFTTPAGHSGVTFVASSGDSGSSFAPEYPSVSPNVLAVGGTQLSTDSLDNYLSETGWSGSGGGISVSESQPNYQKGVVTQNSSLRTVPDVAYDGSGSSPFAVYDTSSYSGWLQVCGTSAGAPQWAALVAVADQGRALAGLGALDGPGQTLPLLYQLPAGDFHDITSGSNGAYAAGPGYDLVTGRGSPEADQVVAGLFGLTLEDQPPVIATPASASASPVTATTTTLSVQASDDGSVSNLTYSWSVLTAPAGATAPTFSVNGTNSAQNTTVTFYQAGTYAFQVTVTDAGGLTAASSVNVTVNQKLTMVVVTPAKAGVLDGATQQFTATANDQFGRPMSTQPAWNWSMASGAGKVSSSGLYTAPATGNGTASVRANGAGLNGTAAINFGTFPTAPVNLTAQVPPSGQVGLAWKDHSNNETGFLIGRSADGINWVQVAAVGAGTQKYTDSSVAPDQTYYYCVCAFNSFGTSANTNVVKVTTPGGAPAAN